MIHFDEEEKLKIPILFIILGICLRECLKSDWMQEVTDRIRLQMRILRCAEIINPEIMHYITSYYIYPLFM